MTVHSNLIRAGEGHAVDLGAFGARYLVRDAGFALLEHPIAARSLAAPLHTHAREDEYSFVLEGEVGFQLGDEVLYATAGDLVLKPRGVPHAFWNRSDAPARVLELIAPGGFEAYFEELAPLLPPARPQPDFAGLAALWEKYGISMDPASIGVIAEREGLAV